MLHSGDVLHCDCVGQVVVLVVVGKERLSAVREDDLREPIHGDGDGRALEARLPCPSIAVSSVRDDLELLNRNHRSEEMSLSQDACACLCWSWALVSLDSQLESKMRIEHRACWSEGVRMVTD